MMKRVSFEIAKALKEAGYPQNYSFNVSVYDKDGNVVANGDTDIPLICDAILAPTYIETWLWLWREKGIRLNTNTQREGIVCIYLGETIIHEVKDLKITDPEEAIIAAIEHLVELIK